MKKTINCIISILIIVYSLNFTSVIGSEDLICLNTQFEIKSINDNQTSTVIACANSFEESITLMNQNRSNYPDLTIQYKGAANPNKIIAATRGIAGSSSTSSTLDIFENSNFSGESTYVPNNVDMAYYETLSYNTGTGSGKVKVKISGFLGYTELSNLRIIPLKFIENGWSFEGFMYRMNEYRVSSSSTGGVREIYHQTFPFPGSSNLQGTYLYGPAPPWLANGTYYSWDGVSYYIDREMKNPVLDGTNIGKYYQYYQYLPLRSTSNISSSQLNAFLVSEGFSSKATTWPRPSGGSAMYNEGDAFTKNQLLYGVNSLVIYAMALHESGRGTSRIAIENNNLFGWGAVDSSPLQSAKIYDSISEGIAEHMGKQIRGYLSTDNWRYFGSILGNKRNGMNTKYASDPYWGQKIASWAYRIDKSANLIDYQYFKIAIIENESGRNFRPASSISSNVLYTIPKRSIEHSIIVNDMTTIDGKNWFSTTGTNPIRYNSYMEAQIFSRSVNASNVNIELDQLIIPNHGFGPVGSYINLKYTGRTGDAIQYLVSTTLSRSLLIGDISQLVVIDENTLQFRNEGCGRDLSAAGTGTHTFELYKELVVTYERSSCQLIPYYWTESTGYIQSDNFYISSPGKSIKLTPGVYDESFIGSEPISELKSYSFSEGKLIINGIGLKKGISAPYSDYVNYDISFVSDSNLFKISNVSKLEDKVLTELYGLNRLNYDYASYSGVIDLSGLSVGTYNLLLDAKFNPPNFDVSFLEEITSLVSVSAFYSYQGKSFQLTKNSENQVQLVITLGEFVILKGDVNGDGKVTVTDLVMLHLTIAGVESFPGFVTLNADMNSDGKISITDMVMLHLLISGIEY